MPYSIKTINERILSDPSGFTEECDKQLEDKITLAAGAAADNLKRSPVILLCGPSASGKTTVAKMLARRLFSMGIPSHTISLDDYFYTVSPETSPRDPWGDYDFESPLCVDFELVHAHLQALSEGREAALPRFDFPTKSRAEGSVGLRLGKGEMLIYEGIHALNDRLTHGVPGACKICVSADSNIDLGDGQLYKNRWIRFTRRLVRDFNFRATGPVETLRLWRGVERGEELYIDPFLTTADIRFDSVLPYELCAFRPVVLPMLEDIRQASVATEMTAAMAGAIARFAPLPLEQVPRDSLIREFTGS